MNFKTIVVLLSFSLSALVAAVAAEVPEYGRGYDVYTTSSAAVLSGRTLFFTWPVDPGRPERYLVAVDVADAATPKLLDKLALDGFPQDLTLDDDRAYVVNGRDLLVIDIADPTALRLQHRLRIDDDPLRGPQGIALAEGMAWLACRRGGIKAVELRDGQTPRIAGAADVPAFVRGVTVSGQYLYAAGDTRGVFVFDVSEPAAPRQLHHEPAPAGCIGRIAIHDGIAYLAAGNLLAATLSLADPSQPRWLGATENRHVMSPFYGGYAHDLALISQVCAETGVSRALAVVADGESGLIVADVSRPEAPRFLGAVLSEGLGGAYVATGLALNGDIVYLIDQSFGLRLVDISRPERPTQIGEGLKW